MRNWRTYVVAGLTLALMAVAGWLALPHLPPVVRVWERGVPGSPRDSAREITLTGGTGSGDSAGAVSGRAGGSGAQRTAAADTRAGSAGGALHVAVVIGPMLRVPTRAVAPQPVPPPDPFAAAIAKELTTRPARTAFGTPSVALPELANRPEVTRALRRMYPAELKRIAVAGTSVIRLRIDEEGRVIRRYVVATSGNMLLDRVAVSSATLMRFVPARFEGKTVRSEVDIPITFAVMTPADTALRPRSPESATTAPANGGRSGRRGETATATRAPSRTTPTRSAGTTTPAR